MHCCQLLSTRLLRKSIRMTTPQCFPFEIMPRSKGRVEFAVGVDKHVLDMGLIFSPVKSTFIMIWGKVVENGGRYHRAERPRTLHWRTISWRLASGAYSENAATGLLESSMFSLAPSPFTVEENNSHTKTLYIHQQCVIDFLMPLPSADSLQLTYNGMCAE